MMREEAIQSFIKATRSDRVGVPGVTTHSWTADSWGEVRVSVCFDDRQTVLIFTEEEILDDYGKCILDVKDAAKLLVDRKLANDTKLAKWSLSSMAKSFKGKMVPARIRRRKFCR